MRGRSGPADENGSPSGAASLESPSRSARQAQRRQQMLVAAIELLEEREYDRIQVRDVAERAGVALTTMYRYFDSKELLYASAMLQWSTDFFQRVESRGGGFGDSDVERLRSMLFNMLRTLERWPQFIRAVTILDSSIDADVQAHLRAFYERCTHAFRLCIRTLDSTTADTVVMIVNSVYSDSVRHWAQQQLTIDEVGDRLQRAVRLVMVDPDRASA